MTSGINLKYLVILVVVYMFFMAIVAIPLYFSFLKWKRKVGWRVINLFGIVSSVIIMLWATFVIFRAIVVFCFD